MHTELVLNRTDFILNHPSEDGEASLHPDLRMIPCPAELVLNKEIVTRRGNGYTLKDGSWYDPVTKEFMYFITAN